jgi:DnaK suppressor protein
MNANRLKAVRQALVARRSEILADLARLGEELQWLGEEQESERGGLGNHLADDGSSVMEQERISTMADNIRDVLRQVEGALGRIEQGTYGACARCRRPIAEARLAAFPYVEFCIECQSELERRHALYGAVTPVGRVA